MQGTLRLGHCLDQEVAGINSCFIWWWRNPSPLDGATDCKRLRKISCATDEHMYILLTEPVLVEIILPTV